jgi:hypothetical protein
MSTKPRGLANNPLERANKALGLDEPHEPPARAPEPPKQLETPPLPLQEAEEAPTAPAEKRRTARSRTGTYGNPYPRRDGTKTVKCSFNVSLEFYQELRRFEAELPPKQRNAWMERALRRAINQTRNRRAAARPGDDVDVDGEV